MSKIKLTTKKLIAAISSVSANVQKKALNPINGFVLMTIENGRFGATTSNDRCLMSQFFTVEEDTEFSVCVHCTILLNTIKLLKSEFIELEDKTRANGSRYLFIKSGRGKYKLDITSSTEFQKLGFGETIDTLTVNGDGIFEKIKVASGCVDGNDVRPAFTAITIKSEGSEGSVTGFSPAYGTEQSMSVVSGQIRESFIPKDVCNLLGMNPMSGETIISLSEKRIKINNGAFEMIGNLINTDPLPLDSLWSQQTEEVYVVNREDLLDSVTRVLNFTGMEDKMIVLDFSGKDLRVVADDANNGNSGEEMVNIISSNCGDLVVGIDGNNLSACLRSIHTPEVVINARADNKPIFIKDSSIGNSTQKWMIAPVKIDQAIAYRKDKDEERKAKQASKGTIAK